MNTDVDEMDITQIENSVHDWFLETERNMPVPKEWLVTFGRWSQFRDFIDDLVWSYRERLEELDKYAHDEKKLSVLQEAIAEVSSDIAEIDDIVIDYEEKTDNCQHVEQELGKIIKRLDELADSDWDPENEYKKKKKGGKK